MYRRAWVNAVAVPDRESGTGEHRPSLGPGSESEEWPLAKSCGSYRLSLVDHSIDVAAVAEARLRGDETCRKKLVALAGLGREDLSDTEQARLCFLVGLHDAGKVNHAFQDSLKKKETGGGNSGGGDRHCGALWPVVCAQPHLQLVGFGPTRVLWEDVRKAFRSAVDWESWFACSVAADRLWRAVLAHHSSSKSLSRKWFYPWTWSRRAGRDPCVALTKLVRVLAGMFGERLHVRRDGSEPLPLDPVDRDVLHAFAEFVTAVDHCGSREGEFRSPYDGDGAPTGSARFDWARDRATRLVRSLSSVPFGVPVVGQCNGPATRPATPAETHVKRRGKSTVSGSGMRPGGFRRPSRPSRGVTTGPTRAASVQKWGDKVAGQIRRGESVLQQPQASPPPQGLPCEKNGQKQAPHNFGGTRRLILRTVAHDRGYEDTRFATERTARDYNEMHGDTDKVRGGVVRGGVANFGIAIPGYDDADQLRRVMVEVRLAEDGPNFNANGKLVDGKKRDRKFTEKGHVVEELRVMEGQRRGHGEVTYFNVQCLRLPSLEARAEAPKGLRHEFLREIKERTGVRVEDEGAAWMEPRNCPLQVVEVGDLAGTAHLRVEEIDLDGSRETVFVLRVGPPDTFLSEDHYCSAVVHEVHRFWLCRDGDFDATVAALAGPVERVSMPEFARSELLVSLATMDRMTEVGYTWHPPEYSPEHRSQLREAQAVQLEEPGGLDEVGRQADCVYGLSREFPKPPNPAVRFARIVEPGRILRTVFGGGVAQRDD